MTDPQTQRDLQTTESVLSLLATVAIAGGAPGMIASGVLGGISAGLRLLFPPEKEDFAKIMADQLAALDKILAEQMAQQSVRNEMADFLADINVLLNTVKEGREDVAQYAKTLDWQAFREKKTELQAAVDAACEGNTSFLRGLQKLKSNLGTTPASPMLTLGLFSTGAALHVQLELMRSMWQGSASDAQWIQNIIVAGDDYHTHIATTLDEINKHIANRMDGVQPPTEYTYRVYKQNWKGYEYDDDGTRVGTCISDKQRGTPPKRDAKSNLPFKKSEKYRYEWVDDPGSDVVDFADGTIESNTDPKSDWPIRYPLNLELDTRQYYAHPVVQEAALFVAQHHLRSIIDRYTKIKNSPGSAGFLAGASGEDTAAPACTPVTVGPIASAAEYNELTRSAGCRVLELAENTIPCISVSHEGFLAASHVEALGAGAIQEDPDSFWHRGRSSLPETLSGAVNTYAAMAYIAFQVAERVQTYITETHVSNTLPADFRAQAKAALDAALDASTGPEGNIAMYRTCRLAEGLSDIHIPVPPALPVNVTAQYWTAVGDLAVRWTATAGTNTAYKIYGSKYPLVAAEHGRLLCTVDGTKTKAMINQGTESPDPAEVKYIVVSAIAGQQEAYTQAVAVDTRYYAAPALPTAITPTLDPKLKEIDIAWTPTADSNSHYDIYASTHLPAGDDHGTKIKRIDGWETGVFIRPPIGGFTVDTIKYIVIAAVSLATPSEETQIFSAPALVTDPRAPKDVKAVYQPNTRTIQINWTTDDKDGRIRHNTLVSGWTASPDDTPGTPIGCAVSASQAIIDASSTGPAPETIKYIRVTDDFLDGLPHPSAIVAVTRSR
ncbi:hypothetical protein AB0A77_24640 [Streptomyces varsoviensis]|uniref:hypothetical protein n=1 Tax=Streptomyces varsoviensis TaxID=67373 RepID=UPI0033FEFEE3